MTCSKLCCLALIVPFIPVPDPREVRSSANCCFAGYDLLMTRLQLAAGLSIRLMKLRSTPVILKLHHHTSTHLRLIQMFHRI